MAQVASSQGLRQPTPRPGKPDYLWTTRRLYPANSSQDPFPPIHLCPEPNQGLYKNPPSPVLTPRDSSCQNALCSGSRKREQPKYEEWGMMGWAPLSYIINLESSPGPQLTVSREEL
ncbi:unnamed protein product [Arctogadus glacialis]